jgi:glycosyltransferase involved in cell wall biosynthesis
VPKMQEFDDQVATPAGVPIANCKKTVLILTTEPPESMGGMEHMIREMIRGLTAHGYRTDVFYGRNSEPAWTARRGGPIRTKLHATLRGYWVGKNAERHMTESVTAVISNSDVGYYRLQSPWPFKRIHFCHGTYRGQSEAIRPFISYGGYLYLKWWDSMLLERLSGRGKLILTCSDQVSEEVSRFFGQTSVPVWVPIDTQTFKPLDVQACREALSLPQKRPIGLFVGSTHPMKGFPIIRALCKRMDDVHWVLALRGNVDPGDGYPASTILRDVSPSDLPVLYSAADFSVCPSLYEPFGYVVAEALACGTPVIATPGGASRLLLRESPFDGLLIRDRNSLDAFCAAVREVLRDPSFYRRAVIERIRPKLHELLATENWWRRFAAVTGL